MDAAELVSVDLADGVATVRLDHAARANVLSAAMMAALSAAFATVEARAEARVVVLAAAGRVFSAGHDLDELLAIADRAALEAHFARAGALMGQIRGLRLPVIARVQGTAVAAGCQLVAACDLAYAADSARFGINGIDLGLFCGTPSVELSRAIAPKQVMELGLTGRLIPAARAAEIGLVNAAVPADDLDATVLAAARAILGKPAEAVALGKALVRRQAPLGYDDAYRLAAAAMADNMALPETRQRIAGFTSRRRA